ncbi:RNA-directed DNA polymerase, eukaryota, reverse transcriptase zinc-binding domain protein, partial [Tanacetum coccineum]
VSTVGLHGKQIQETQLSSSRGIERFYKRDNGLCPIGLVEHLQSIWACVDAYFPNRRSKAGKRFQREPLNKHSKLHNDNGVKRGNLGADHNDKGVKGTSNSYAYVVKESQHSIVDMDVNPVLVLDDACLNKKDYSFCLIGKVKEFASISNLKVVLVNEGFNNIKIKYMGGYWVMIEFHLEEAKKSFQDNSGMGAWFSQIQQVSYDFIIDGRVTWVEVEGIPLKRWSENTFRRVASKWGVLLDMDDQEDGCYHIKRICINTKVLTNIFESFKVIYRGKVVWVRAKELPGWIPDFVKDNEEEDDLDDGSFEGEPKVGDFKIDEELEGRSNAEVVPDTKFDEDPHRLNVEVSVGQINMQSKDPFSFTPRESKDVSKENGKRKENGYQEDEIVGEKKTNSENNSKNEAEESVCLGHFKKYKVPKSGGSILQLIDDLVKVGQTMGYDMKGLAQKAKKDRVKGICMANKVNFLSLQETKMESIDLFCIKRCLGNFAFDYEYSVSVGNSSGILCVWDPKMFKKMNATVLDYFVMVRGEVVIMGDFNEVRNKSERFGTVFNRQGVDAFNLFIANDGLSEVPLGGFSFTLCHKSVTKMRKLDRFLILDSLLFSCPNTSSFTLDRYISDHHPILMREVFYDYRPIMFRFFHYWYELEGFDKFVEDSWKESLVSDSNALVKMMKKLKYLKEKIRMWNKSTKGKLYNRKRSLKAELADCDSKINKSEGEANIKWAIEGDENSKYYHGVLNKKRSQLNIRGIMVDSTWIDSPSLVKSDLVNEVQSAFVADRQILDGPFILNELVQWCKKKKKKSLILRLISKRLMMRLGDPLSPFLFILVMESLYISFQRVVDGGLFKGIELAHSLNLSHLFFADDAIFMGQWSESNIDTVVHVLECFHSASGLRINMIKSKLLGIAVKDDKVEQAAMKIGCTTLKTPFSYLGSKLGSLMSRVHSWNETIEVSMNVLHRMESIWSKFFNGVDSSSKKSVWVKWKSALASKDKGGLGVSSLFALNRALMFKWVWRFVTQSSSLWARVIKVLHGDDGKIGKKAKSSYPFIWLDIIHKVELFKSRGIDLVSFIHSKLGNKANTSFGRWLSEGNLSLQFSFRRAPRGGAVKSQFEMLKEKVEGCTLIDMKDRWVWALAGSGDFLVASVRKLIDDFMLPEVSSKTRWIKVIPIKVNVHAWKVKLDCLPTRFNISSRGMDIESILCPICGKAAESTTHIFFKCHISREILRKIARWWDIDYMEVSSYDEWLDWILNIRLSSKHKHFFEGVCYVLWWHVWSFQNKIIFGRDLPSKAIIFDDVVPSSVYWCRYLSHPNNGGNSGMQHNNQS